MYQSLIKVEHSKIMGAPHEINPTKSESVVLFVTNITALHKMILYTFTSHTYLTLSRKQCLHCLGRIQCLLAEETWGIFSIG